MSISNGSAQAIKKKRTTNELEYLSPTDLICLANQTVVRGSIKHTESTVYRTLLCVEKHGWAVA